MLDHLIAATDDLFGCGFVCVRHMPEVAMAGLLDDIEPGSIEYPVHGLIPDLKRDKMEHYAAIGEVAANWAFFEHQLDSACIRLGKFPEIFALCLTSQISGHSRKLDAYMAIAKLLEAPGPLEKRINKISEKARVLAEKRNRVVHDPWLVINPTVNARRFEITARRTLRAELILQPTGEVRKLANDIYELSEAFMRLSTEVANACALPETPDESSPG